MPTLPLPTVADCRLIEAASRGGDGASLHVIETGAHVPFTMRRLFYIHADEAVARGRHAHRQCLQLLIAMAGRVSVTLKDGDNERLVDLDNPGRALLVPAGVWGEQRYSPGAILLVACDRAYDEADYVRDWDQFLAWRQQAR